MSEPSASLAYLSRLIDGAEHDAGVLRDLEWTIATPSDLTAADATVLRGRVWKALARLAELERMDVPDLIAACDAGDHSACVELDRRGIEPPTLEPRA